MASLHKSRGETEEMYGVRSKVSNALYKVADIETPRAIGGVTIPESVRQQASSKYDDALYRKKADDIAVKYIGKEYLANENEVLDFFSKWMANYSAGKLGEAYGDSGYSYASKPTDARKYYKDTVENVQNAFIGRNSGTVGQGGVISKNLASYLPQLEGQVKNGLPLALIGGAVGMAVGAPALGVKLGYSLGVGRYSYKQMYGMSFNNLSKVTDFETAKKLARDEGLVSGGVETFDTLWDIASLGGGAVLKALGKESVKKIGKTSLFKLLGGYALNVIGEGGQESVQELISIANERRAQKGNVDSGLVGLVGETVSLINEIAKGENDAALKRAKEAGIEGMKTSAVIGGPSLALNTATANVLEKNANAGVDKEQENVYFLIEHDENGHEYWQIESDKDIFKGLKKTKELQDAAYDYILHGYKGEEVSGIVDGENLKFIRRSAEEYLYGEASEELSNKEYRQKMRMSPSIVDLIENASIRYDAPDHKEHKMFPDGFKNYQGRVGIDDTIFKYIVRVGKAKSGKIFYDINLEVDGKVPRAKSTSLIKKTSTSNTGSISQNIENDKKKFSTNEDFLGSIAGESRDVKTDSGEDVVFSVRSNKEEKPLKNSVGSGKIKEDGDVEFDSDFDAIFDEAISRVKVTKVRMKVFPPYNKSKSDANERATRWAFNENVQAGAQAIAFYHDQSYIIEKFDSTEFKYIIKGIIDYGDYQNIRKGLEVNAQTGREKSVEDLAAVYDQRNRQRDTTKGRRQDIDGNAVKYGEKNSNVQRVDKVKNSERELEGNTDRSDERNGSYRQSGSLEKDIESSENDNVLLSVGGSLKISENKKTAPTIRESHLESQDRLSPIGTVSNNSISQNDEKNNKNITKLYERLGYSVISEPNPEVKLPDGAIVDGYVDHKRGEVYISPTAANGVYKHELMHIISRMSKRNSQSFLNFCKKNVAEWDELYKENEKKYNEIRAKNPDFKVDEELLEQETIADLSIRLSQDDVIEKYRDSSLDFLGRVRLWYNILTNQAAVYFGKDSSQERKLKIAAMKWELALASAKRKGIVVKNTGIAFSSNVEDYPYDMQTVIKSYLEYKDEGLYAVVRNYRENPKTAFKAYIMGMMDEVHSAAIKEKTGVDVSEFECAINKNAIEHIESNHGVNGKTDKSLANLNDIARIPYILNNFDSIDLVYEGDKPALSKVYKNKDNSKAQMVKISKKINGTFYTVLAVPDSSSKRMWVVSAYINKNDGITQDSDVVNTPETTSKNELASLPSNKSLPQKEEDINKNISFSVNTPDSSRKGKRQSVEDIESELDDIAERLDSPDITLSEEDELLDRQFKLEGLLRSRKRMREREIRDIDMASAKRSVGENDAEIDGGMPKAQLDKYRETGDSLWQG